MRNALARLKALRTGGSTAMRAREGAGGGGSWPWGPTWGREVERQKLAERRDKRERVGKIGDAIVNYQFRSV